MTMEEAYNTLIPLTQGDYLTPDAKEAVATVIIGNCPINFDNIFAAFESFDSIGKKITNASYRNGEKRNYEFIQTGMMQILEKLDLMDMFFEWRSDRRKRIAQAKGYAQEPSELDFDEIDMEEDE